MITYNWTCPLLWEEQTVFIIGGGPSVNETPLHLIHDRNVIGVNSAFRFGDWIDVCLFCDACWFNLEYEELRSHYRGQVIGLYPFQDKEELNQHDGVNVKLLCRAKQPRGLANSQSNLRYNSSCGGAAIDLAVHLGVRSIVLIGYDMRAVNGRYNFHDCYPWRPIKESGPYTLHKKAYPTLNIALKKEGIKIINATPNSTIGCLPIMTLEEAIEEVA